MRATFILLLLHSSILVYCQQSNKKQAQKISKSVSIFLGQSTSMISGSEIDFLASPSFSFPNRGVVDRKALSVSILFKQPISQIFYLKFGGGFIPKGGEVIGSSSFYRPIFHLNYLNIPVLFGVSTPQKFNARFSVEAGFGANFLMGGDRSWHQSNGFFDSIKEPFDASVAINFEGDISEKLAFAMNIRFIKDLSPFSDRQFQDLNYQIYSSNQILSLGLIYKDY